MSRISLIAVSMLAMSAAAADITVHGTLHKWHPLTVDNTDAASLNESQDNPNPFLDYRYNVTFTSPKGNDYEVPGYFAGNGMGQGTGSTWRAKFSADEAGVWQYKVSFRSGEDIAVSLVENEGTALATDGETGSFTITEQQSSDPGFLAHGRLQYTGKHYLKFTDGGYWLKGGVDSPENFLGYAGFDNTVDQHGGANTDTLADGIHRYEPHIADWQSGDPLFTNAANPDGAKGIIGAINYLASEAVNSIYFLPMNLGGDGRETYPFIETGGSHADNTHFDISKLFQWGIVLDHMQNKGVAAHIVLGETENRNMLWLDQATLGIQRKLYYREMVARFAHLLALKWNLSEESRYSDEEHIEFAEYIRQLDWAEHPMSVHTQLNRPHENYDALLGNPVFDTSSIQYSPRNAGKFVELWRRKTADAGWPWVIDMDEIDPPTVGLNGSNTDELRKSVLYPVYFSGGNLEWYFGYHELPLGGDMRTEDFRTRADMYRYMRYARELIQNEMPFWEMQPADDLFDGKAFSKAEVFAKPGEIYAVYLPDVSNNGVLNLPAGEYQKRWFNPRTGAFEGAATLVSESPVSFDDVPVSTTRGGGESAVDTETEDWVILFQRRDNSSAATTGVTIDEAVTGNGGTTGAATSSGGNTGANGTGGAMDTGAGVFTGGTIDTAGSGGATGTSGSSGAMDTGAEGLTAGSGGTIDTGGATGTGGSGGAMDTGAEGLTGGTIDTAGSGGAMDTGAEGLTGGNTAPPGQTEAARPAQISTGSLDFWFTLFLLSLIPGLRQRRHLVTQPV